MAASSVPKLHKNFITGSVKIKFPQGKSSRFTRTGQENKRERRRKEGLWLRQVCPSCIRILLTGALKLSFHKVKARVLPARDKRTNENVGGKRDYGCVKCAQAA